MDDKGPKKRWQRTPTGDSPELKADQTWTTNESNANKTMPSHGRLRALRPGGRLKEAAKAKCKKEAKPRQRKLKESPIRFHRRLSAKFVGSEKIQQKKIIGANRTWPSCHRTRRFIVELKPKILIFVRSLRSVLDAAVPCIRDQLRTMNHGRTVNGCQQSGWMAHAGQQASELN